MAILNLRGARLDLTVTPPAGVFVEVQAVDADDNQISLENATVKAFLIDGDASSRAQRNDFFGALGGQEYNLTITDALAGKFNLVFPSTAFDRLWGQQVSYSAYAFFPGNPGPLALFNGNITLQIAF